MSERRSTAETPGFCKAEDLASLFAVPVHCIRQLTGDGVLTKRDTPVGKRYNVVESTRSYTQHLRDKAFAGTASKEQELRNAELRIAQAKAEIAEREAQELQGWPL